MEDFGGVCVSAMYLTPSSKCEKSTFVCMHLCGKYSLVCVCT